MDQLTPKGLEKAFVYWKDLVPMSERFKSEFGAYGVGPGSIDLEGLIGLRIFTQEQFEGRLRAIQDELMAKSNGEWIDYRQFIEAETFEEKVVRAYLLAFVLSEGKATMKTDPLSGKIWVIALGEKAGGTPKSMAVSVAS